MSGQGHQKKESIEMRVEWECHVYKECYEEILSLIIQAYMTM